MINKPAFAWILLLYGFPLARPAQLLPATVGTPTVQKSEAQSRRRAGQLAGYVTADSGRPLARAQVTITNIADVGASGRRIGVTDEQGGFQFNGVPDGAYALSVRAPGYVRTGDSTGSKYYRPGDFVAISMQKGGVITGTVKNHAGEPLINVPVRALRVEDMDRKAKALNASFASRLTDDRGVYRLYGLEPGVYVVCAGGGSRSYAGFNKYENETPTYHPSSVRQTAGKVMVAGGQEVGGVDIAYRGEKGHAVSGVVIGVRTTRFGPATAVALGDWSTREIIGVGSTVQDQSFAFYGVPDGDYYLIARHFADGEQEGAVSKPTRIKVAGGDVAGAQLTLSPLASVSGLVVLEPLPKESPVKCALEPNALVEDAVVSLYREPSEYDPGQLWDTDNIHGGANDRGRFILNGISAGRYRIDASLFHESWFAKSLVMLREPASDPKRATDSGPGNPILESLSVQSGDRTRLKITFAEGAATLNGRVLGPRGKPLPSRLYVHLVPAEPLKTSDEVLRFLESEVREDGSFSLEHIAPGKYWVFAKSGANRPSVSLSAPSSWTATGRAMLRKEGQKSKAAIELGPCQSAKGYVVTYN
ncbi:MAG: carboxypeptidase-like regulatory domain-containing protein [Acidobacteriota bacterium]